MMNIFMKRRRKTKRQLGVSIVESLVAISVASVVMVAMMKEYTNTLRFAKDEEIKSAALVRAQAVLEAMGSELRVLGNGVPYDQPNFQIGESTLSDPTVTEPIDVATAATDSISFRLNETGEVYLLMNNYDPSASLTFTLTSTEGLVAGDPIYLSNSVVGDDDGLFGVVQSVNSATNEVTLQAGPVYSPGAIFDMGTICERVPLITYTSPADGSGITRDAGLGAVLFAQNSRFTLDYVDFNGNAMALPITANDLVNSVRRVRVTVTVDSESPLRDGTIYTATVSQTYSLRNLNYLF